ncbi:hypothetical protein IAU59_002502 [Kwoniella sp. CBS 9459]
MVLPSRYDGLPKEEWTRRAAETFSESWKTDLPRLIDNEDTINQMTKDFSGFLDGWWDRHLSKDAGDSGQPSPGGSPTLPNGTWQVRPQGLEEFRVNITKEGTTSRHDTAEDQVLYGPHSRRGSLQTTRPQPRRKYEHDSKHRWLSLKIYDDHDRPEDYTEHDIGVPRDTDVLPADEWVEQVTKQVTERFEDTYSSRMSEARKVSNITNLRAQVIKEILSRIGINIYHRTGDSEYDEQRSQTGRETHTPIELRYRRSPTEDEWMECVTEEIVKGVRRCCDEVAEAQKTQILENAFADARSMYQSLFQSQPGTVHSAVTSENRTR